MDDTAQFHIVFQAEEACSMSARIRQQHQLQVCSGSSQLQQRTCRRCCRKSNGNQEQPKASSIHFDSGMPEKKWDRKFVTFRCVRRV